MRLSLNKFSIVLYLLLHGWPALGAPVVEVQLRVVTRPSTVETLILPASVASVCVDTQIILEVWVLSTEPDSPGIAGGTVNVAFTTGAIIPVEIDHNLTFDLLTTGTIDSISGTIVDLGGNTLVLGAAVTPMWALLARVTFFTAVTKVVVFSISPGSLRFALSGGEPPLDFTTDVFLGPEQLVSIGEVGTYGDFDCNNHVDISDFTTLKDCLNGPGLTSSACDADFDGDTDLLDFSIFQTAYTGSGS